MCIVFVVYVEIEVLVWLIVGYGMNLWVEEIWFVFEDGDVLVLVGM